MDLHAPLESAMIIKLIAVLTMLAPECLVSTRKSGSADAGSRIVQSQRSDPMKWSEKWPELSLT